MTVTLKSLRAAEAFQEIEALHGLGFNYEYDKNPFLTFLDLIGFSQENYGQSFHKEPELDFMAMEYLADALKKYGRNPEDAIRFIELLLEEELD